MPRRLVLTSFAIALVACNEHPLKPVELQKGQECSGQVHLAINKDVDILFVVDNSGSMGEEQANLADNFGSFIDVLEQDGVEANYRIGVTTTDNGNPWCPTGVTTPESGRLVMSSCKDRLGDFVFGSNPPVDVQDLACNDICSLTAEQLEILPTTTEVDPMPTPRPWLENIEGRKNIPEGTDTAEAFKCFGPQGVNGCGFESQLESMYLALARAADGNEESYGFMRDHAILAVVFVTDEVDCSYDKDWDQIFDADGNRVFWSDPDAAFPTSAVCWNAGVECVGDPSGYDSCDPVNKDIDGNVGVSDDQAVLHPIARYIDRLQGIEDAKRQLNPDQEVIVALIAGVGSDGTPYYSDVTNTDPEFQNSFGIGPGCTGEGGVSAVPPVRERDVTEAFSIDNMFSVCDSNYSGPLERIADLIRDQIEPACYTQCAKDTDLSTATLEPECTVEQRFPGEDDEAIEECLRNLDGTYAWDGGFVLPGGVDVCYVARSDDGNLTADPNDDMADECTDAAYNLEFEVVRSPGVPAPAGTVISATCSLSDFPQLDCPGLAPGSCST